MRESDLDRFILEHKKTTNERHYFGGNNGKTFSSKLLAEHIMEDNHFIYDGNFLYRYELGVYRIINDYVIRKKCAELLEDRFKKSYGDEVVHYIQVTTFRKTENANARTDLINVSNGLLEWRKRKLHPHTPEYFTTIQIPIYFKPEAIAPNIDTFFRSVVPEDTMSIVYEWFGYCMLPITKYEKAVMLTGEGSNGKSKFIELFHRFLGTDNISNISLQDLEHNRFKLAQLHGKLANTYADIPSKALVKSSVFKTVVSGDRTSAEFKGKDSFNFQNFARLLFSANELPRSSDLTDGFFRRWIIIPFNNKFGPGGIKADPNIMDKLTNDEELSGLLNRALDGLEWLEKQGHFTLNESTDKMLEEYKLDIDNVATFVDENCKISPNRIIERQLLYRYYSNWCFNSGYKAIGLKKFYNRIETGFPVSVTKPHGKQRCYVGIALN
ncbi:DNA primase family protein [Bacillus sp. FJAT-22090]|uniref:DNA primase family protein n=1 Tax=Bacillus sp. FJAT-22090 TaxID=1581038 RepID=UPI0006AEBC1A|nr:DNA primase family protein [Bacillus sp. FJAT-22090]